MILRAVNLSFAYRNAEPVLNDVSLDILPGVVTGLFGPNGSGKSTLLRCLSGSLVPFAGQSLLDGRPIARMTRREIARHIAVIPQDTPCDVPLTVREMVVLGRYPHGNLLADQTPQDTRIVNESLERLGIQNLAHRPFSQLSGGERQRVIIARALAQQAPIILMDEPNAHLDLAHQLEVYHLARSLAQEGKSVLMICHDLLIAPLMMDKALIFSKGSIVATGAPRDILTPDRLWQIFGLRAMLQWNDALGVRLEMVKPQSLVKNPV